MTTAMTSREPVRPAESQRLSWRARGLLKLERLFPVIEAPCQSGEHSAYEYRKAVGSYAGFVEALGGLEGKQVLDFGCGWGGETVWLAQQARQVTGCDIDPRSLADAERFRAHSGQDNLSFALVEGDRLPLEDDQFDAVFSTNVFEHVMRPDAMLAEIRRVLRPGGAFLSRFGPLFYSPLGYHLCWATQVPFAHLLLGLGPIIEVRNTKRSSISPTCWEDTGLNRITCKRFRAAVARAGLTPRRIKRIPVKGQSWLAHLPLVGNLFTFGIDCHLVKPSG